MVATYAQRTRLGQRGEDAAAQFVMARGWRVVDRNWRCAQGEIDLVALDPSARDLVVIEVKTRSSARYGSGVEAVTARKAARLRRLAAQWLAEHPGAGDEPVEAVRIDVIGVLAEPDGRLTLEHVVGVGG